MKLLEVTYRLPVATLRTLTVNVYWEAHGRRRSRRAVTPQRIKMCPSACSRDRVKALYVHTPSTRRFARILEEACTPHPACTPHACICTLHGLHPILLDGDSYHTLHTHRSGEIVVGLFEIPLVANGAPAFIMSNVALFVCAIASSAITALMIVLIHRYFPFDPLASCRQRLDQAQSILKSIESAFRREGEVDLEAIALCLGLPSLIELTRDLTT